MANFYSRWINKNKSDNEELLQELSGGANRILNTSSASVPATVPPPDPTIKFSDQPSKPSDIFYENSDLRLIVHERKHSRQKNFKIQDALFEIKVITLNNSINPRLLDLLTFLEKGFELILSKIRQFFKADEHKIAFLTLYQSPMVKYERHVIKLERPRYKAPSAASLVVLALGRLG